jgi:hypothetical protein
MTSILSSKFSMATRWVHAAAINNRGRRYWGRIAAVAKPRLGFVVIWVHSFLTIQVWIYVKIIKNIYARLMSWLRHWIADERLQSGGTKVERGSPDGTQKNICRRREKASPAWNRDVGDRKRLILWRDTVLFQKCLHYVACVTNALDHRQHCKYSKFGGLCR